MYSVESCVRIENLNFSVDDLKILENVSVEIEKGAFYSIIGPNGSGKTTLLKHICNIISPKKRSITIDGIDVTDYGIKGLAKKISYVPQDMGADYDFLVKDVVLMGRSPYIRRFDCEGPEDIKIAEKAMKLTNTFGIRDKNIRNLSGGERQRVIIARALTQGGNVLILDEPTSHLDIQHQIEIMDTIKKLNMSRKITVIAVLHDLNLASAYSDYLILLNKGSIEACGSPEEVITKENIKNVYNLDAIVMKNPVNGKPYIIPKSTN